MMRPQRWSDRQEGALALVKRRIREPTNDNIVELKVNPRKEVVENDERAKDLAEIVGAETNPPQWITTRDPVSARRNKISAYVTCAVFVFVSILCVLYGDRLFSHEKAGESIEAKFQKFVSIEHCDYVRTTKGSRTEASIQITVFNGSGFDCEPKDRCNGNCLCSNVGTQFKLPGFIVDFDDSGRTALVQSATWDNNLLTSNPPRRFANWSFDDVPKNFTALRVRFADKNSQETSLCEQRNALDRWSWPAR
jgi:hypothetical protein